MTRQVRARTFCFTLIECLIVCSILLILISLVMPALEKTFHHAKLISCKNSQRSIYNGIAYYMEDHGGALPGPCGKWLVSRYVIDDSLKTFASYVAIYEDTVTYNARSNYIPSFICAARGEAVAKRDAPTRHQYLFAKSADHQNARVFGKLGGIDINGNLVEEVPAFHSSEIINPEQLSVRQRGIDAFYNNFRYKPKIESSSVIRRLQFVYSNEYIVKEGDYVESYTHKIVPLEFNFENGDELGFTYARDYENLVSSFNLAGQIPVASGKYAWNEYSIDYDRSDFHLLSPNFKYQYGEYYTGKRQVYSVGLKYFASKYLGIFINGSHNEIKLNQQELDITNLKLKVHTRLNPEVSYNHSLQYDNLSNNIGYHGRLRWEYQPGSEFFFVYTQNWEKDLDNFEREQSSSIFKINYLMRI